MNFNEYQIEAATTAVYQEKMYPITSLMVESAELADLFVKPYLRGDDKKPFREDIISEAGDVLWNLAVLLNDHGISFNLVAETNLRKLQDRKERGVLMGSGGNR